MIIGYWRSDFPYDWSMIFHLTFYQLFDPPFYFLSEFLEVMSKIYDKEYFLEYKVYLDFNSFFPTLHGYSSSNLFDICEVFIYSKMRRYRIVLLYLLTIFGECGGISDSELEKYEKEYNLIPIASDDCVPFTRELHFPSKDEYDWENGSLFQYIKLEEGIYMLQSNYDA